MKSYKGRRLGGLPSQRSFGNHGSLAVAQQRWRRPPRFLTRMLPIVLAGFGVQAGSARAQLQITDGCMQDTSNKYGGPTSLNCTANDISITAVTLPSTPPDPCDFLGDTTTFDANVEVLSTATSRYDIGVYLALDSGNALTGSCLISTLPRAPTDNNPACISAGNPFPCCTGVIATSTCGYGDLDNPGDSGKYCSLADTQPCNDNGDCTGDVRVCTGFETPFLCCMGPSLSKASGCGTCPAANAAGTDLCGDIDGSAGGHNPVYYKITGITASCIDTDGDGFLDVTACMSWDNQSGNGHLCRSPLAAFPNTPSKCNCQPALKIPIKVARTIQVCKDLIPSTDPGLFNLEFDGTTIFSCSDGTGTCTTGSGPCSDGSGTCEASTDRTDGYCTANVDAGDCMTEGGCKHTVGETAGTGTSLSTYSTNISCFETAGHCTGSASTSCLLNVTCSSQGFGTCDLTPTKVANCTNCTSLSVTVPSNMASKIVCTITNNNCDDCNDCTTDTFNGTTCVHTNVAVGTDCIPQTGPVAGACSSTQDTFACTNEKCDGLGACITTPNNSKCDDLNECTFNNCNPGGPGAGPDGCAYPPVADQTACTVDSVPCTKDVCKSGTCQHIADHSFCNDGATCTNPDLCAPGPGADANGCVFTPVNSKCDDGVTCTSDSCAPGAGADPVSGCVYTTTSCPDDGLYCNGMEICDAAADCIHTGCPCCTAMTPVCCEDTDSCVPECCSNADCPDDGVFCNGTEVCVAGVCGHTGNPCSEDTCDCTKVVCEESNDKCVKIPDPAYTCDDGAFCNGDEFCDLLASGPGTCCVAPGDPCTSPLQCNETKDLCVGCLTDDKCPDNVFCDGVETCDLSTNNCTTSGPDPCPPDPYTCTIDNCIEFGGGTGTCSTKFDDTVCDDGIACTTDVCDPSDPAADPTTGCVYTPVHSSCNDMNECTNDACVPSSCTPPCSGCVFVPKSAGFACGNQTAVGICDNPDICDAFGNCTQNAKPAGTLCRAGGECDPPEFCDGMTKDCPANACTPMGTACTDDGEECTDDECDGFCDCMHPPKQDQTACSSDGNVCTKDVCKSGECAHPGEPTSTPCGNQAALGDCDGADHCDGMGGCDSNISSPGVICRPAVNECDLTEVCTGTDPACPLDDCKPTGDPCTLDSNECTADACNGVCGPTTVACVHPALPDGTFCGNPTSKGICDNPDECKGGSCTPQFEPVTTVCRPAASDCDIEDYCPGDGPDCSADACVAADTPCSSDNDKCTDDVCNGFCGCTHPANALCGACCNRAEMDGGCTDGVAPQDCTDDPQLLHFPDETCAEVEARGACPEHTGACCDEDSFGGCEVLTETLCNCEKCVFHKDALCSEVECAHKAIPTMSQWGLAVLTLLLLIGAKIYFGRRQVGVA